MFVFVFRKAEHLKEDLKDLKKLRKIFNQNVNKKPDTPPKLIKNFS